MKTKTIWQKIFVLVMCTTLLLPAAACDNGGGEADKYSIAVPSEVQNAYTGQYTAPRYEVVNSSGELMTGFSVKLQSVKDSDGANVDIAQDGRTINAVKTGLYEFLYTANSKKVNDAVLKVQFAKEAPSLNFDEETLPAAYVKSLWYPNPVYSFGTGADLSKSYFKIYHNDGTVETEIDLDGGGFTSEYNSGEYKIVLRASDSEDNARDYVYTVPAIGPEVVVPGKIAYFDEEFGVDQFAPSYADVKFSTAYKYENEDGSLEAGSLELTTKTGNFNRMGVLKNLIQKDVRAYKNITFRVYNPNNFVARVHYHEWFGHHDCAPNAWTEISILADDILKFEGGYKGSQDVNSLLDITGLTIVAFKNENNTFDTFPVGTKLYFSAIYATGEAAETNELKIGLFDEESGKSQIAAHNDAEFDTTVRYDNEAGSTKITGAGYQFVGDRGLSLATLESSSPIDVSEYDYLLLRVYNPLSLEVWFWFGEAVKNSGGTYSEHSQKMLKTGEWVEFKITISELERPEDITGLVFFAFTIPGWLNLDGAVHLSAMYAVKVEPEPEPEPEPLPTEPDVVVDHKIGYFDEEFGAAQVTAKKATKFDTDIKYNNEAGSLKITPTGSPVVSAEKSIATLTNPYIKDVSSYDYLVFWVYNPDVPTRLVFGVSNPGYSGDVIGDLIEEWCPTGAWTKIQIDVSKLSNSSDITGLIFGATDAGYNLLTGTVYLSAMYAVKIQPDNEPENIIPGKIGYFDEEFGESQVTAINPTEFVTSVKYDNESGSLKITPTGANAVAGKERSIAALTNPYLKDVSSYDYLLLRVFNPSENAIFIWFAEAGESTELSQKSCAADTWTEFKISVSSLVKPEDITGLILIAANSGWGSLEGTVYLSAMYGINE